MEQTGLFAGGRNVALKIPDSDYQRMLTFYAEVLGLVTEEINENSAKVNFGTFFLWLDRMPLLRVAETWLEVRANDTGAAEIAFAKAGIERCDSVEPLPENYDGFWIRCPTGQVILVSGPRAD